MTYTPRNLTDAVVVCTRNRLDDLEVTLNSIKRNNRVPNYIVVTDSSDGTQAKSLAANLFAESNSRVIYLRSDEKGLVLARNVSLTWLEGKVDVVHFLDDDVILEEAYFETLMTAFENDPDLVGAGGKTNMRQTHSPNGLFVMFGLSTNKPGVVLPNGFASGSDHTNDDHEVSWLPGCSMSFRIAAISGLRFDLNRVENPLGEDIDFGLRAKARGKLMHLDKAQLFHNMALTNRISLAKWAEGDVFHRWRLSQDFPSRVKVSRVIISTVLYGVMYFAGGVITLDSTRIQIGASTLSGLLRLASKTLSPAREH